MERLQKVLAQAGIASRRAAEEIILAGRVRVDGKVVRELGTQVDPRTSRVEVDGNKIVAEKLIYIVLHKPRGVVCTLSDPEGRPTILELLKDAGARVVPVGRLDFHTSGALLCTNDGEFAQALAHPKKAVPKVYVAKVKGAVDDEALDRFSERIVIDGRPTQPAQVKRLRFEGDKTWLEITLREGRNRQVRKLGEATGFPVMRLARISHAGVTSEDLRPGQWRPLSVDELVDLKRDYGVPKKVRAPIFEPALGKGGWSDEPRTPGARRPEPKFSAARRRDAKPSEAGRSSAKRGEPKRFDASGTEPPRFDRSRGPRRDDAPRAEPARFDRSRSPRRDDAPRAEPAHFDRKRSAPRRDDAPRAEPARFDRKRSAPRRVDAPAVVAKPFNAAHREKKRFNAKNAEPNLLEPKRTRTPSRATPFAGERPGHISSRKTPFQGERAQTSDRSSRKVPFQGERAQSARQDEPNRPWKTRSRSANEGGPATNSARPSADRASGHAGRKAPYAKHGGKQNPHQSPNSPRSDARGPAPRRGTSR
jgi:23S rRNA pseudouridine2605 synthase